MTIKKQNSKNNKLIYQNQIFKTIHKLKKVKKKKIFQMKKLRIKIQIAKIIFYKKNIISIL